MKIRNIPNEMPENIFLDSTEKYYDTFTGHKIALENVEYNDKLREMMISYDEDEDNIEIVTIHPVKSHQKLQRKRSGRWIKQ